MVYTLLKGLFVGIVVSAPVGPVGILCLQRTLNKGKAHGFATGLGATLSDMIYAVMAAFSMSMVVDFIEDHQMLLRLGGSLVVFFFGLHTYRDNPVKRLRGMSESKKSSLLQDFLSSFALTITNPLVIFLFIAIFAKFSFMTENMSLLHSAFCMCSILCGAFFWWMLIVNVVNIFREKFNLRGLAIVNQLTGGLLMVLSVLTFIYFTVDTLFF